MAVGLLSALLLASAARAITLSPVAPGVVTSSPTANVSLGNSQGKTLVAKTGSLRTTATTAGQVVLTYTVTTGKTLYLTGGNAIAKSTVPMSAFSSGQNPGGNIWWETPSGTAISSYTVVFTTAYFTTPPMELPRLQEPAPIPSGTVLRAVVTAETTQPIQWIANFIGYEK